MSPHMVRVRDPVGQIGVSPAMFFGFVVAANELVAMDQVVVCCEIVGRASHGGLIESNRAGASPLAPTVSSGFLGVASQQPELYVFRVVVQSIFEGFLVSIVLGLVGQI